MAANAIPEWRLLADTPSRTPLTLEAIYDAHFDFVWRNVRRMGIPESLAEDVVQDVFLVVHRRLKEFDHRSAVTTWLFGILLRVVHDHRRAQKRHNARVEQAGRVWSDRSDESASPHEQAVRRQAVEVLYQLLSQLDEDKRAMVVMVDLEQMAVNEAAAILNLNVNTAQARLRAGRLLFNAAVTAMRKDEHKLMSGAGQGDE